MHPDLALVPVIGFWFDFGLTSRLIVTVLIAMFPVISSTLFGLQSADRGQHDLFTLHRASRLTRLLKLQLPAALPAILTGLPGRGHAGRGRRGGRATSSSSRATPASACSSTSTGPGCSPSSCSARRSWRRLLGVRRRSALFGLLSRVVTGGWYGSTAYDQPA